MRVIVTPHPFIIAPQIGHRHRAASRTKATRRVATANLRADVRNAAHSRRGSSAINRIDRARANTRRPAAAQQRFDKGRRFTRVLFLGGKKRPSGGAVVTPPHLPPIPRQNNNTLVSRIPRVQSMVRADFLRRAQSFNSEVRRRRRGNDEILGGERVVATTTMMKDPR